MQPSGRLHLGNLMGALENWRHLQNDYDCFFFVADWHALSTNYQDTSRIREYSHEMVIDWLAAGLDPEKAVLFLQSQVRGHAVLHLLFSMITPIGWLERVPTYKEKQEQLAHKDLSTYGFLGYPVLQAADILLYRADFVPVGVDQLPHLELTREIGRRFNSIYKTGILPDPKQLLTKFPKITGIDGRKMSKSYNNAIYLHEPEKEVWDKLRTMVTDPARKRRTDPGNPDLCPAFDLHKVFTSGEKLSELDRECRKAGIGCIDCKKVLDQSIKEILDPIRENRKKLIHDEKRIKEMIDEGSNKASLEAEKTLALIHDVMKI